MDHLGLIRELSTTHIQMNYKFEYFKELNTEKHIKIEAENDRQAVMKLFDKKGICQFYCVSGNGASFSDLKFAREKEIIMRGC